MWSFHPHTVVPPSRSLLLWSLMVRVLPKRKKKHFTYNPVWGENHQQRQRSGDNSKKGGFTVILQYVLVSPYKFEWIGH